MLLPDILTVIRHDFHQVGVCGVFGQPHHPKTPQDPLFFVTVHKESQGFLLYEGPGPPAGGHFMTAGFGV